MNEPSRTLRVTALNGAPERTQGHYVLYWMIAARRTESNVALDHALARAAAFARPLVVLEPLRVGYRWASDRMHAFVVQGMADNERAFERAGITYLPYVEPEPGEGKGLLAAVAARACVVVTDEQPGFFLSGMLAAAGRKLMVRLESVDGVGVMPLRATAKPYPTAASFRRHVQKTVFPFLLDRPAATPLRRVEASAKGGEIPGTVLRRWPRATETMLLGGKAALATLPIDHTVAPVEYRGGSTAATAVLTAFVESRLERYEERSHPDADVASGLSPYLHFGHLGVHAVIAAVAAASDWDPAKLEDKKATGSRGWWGLPSGAEAFFDELITWRELGQSFCFHQPDFARYETLPAWAQKTLDEHAKDPRPHVYTLDQLTRSETHDDIWNAAQRQLVVEGRIHNYLRMLWGKKILEWSPSPRAALATLIELNNRYAVDGRDPNSYSGIMWTLGRFDRPWGPTRNIFGTIRYMTSDSTRKKLHLKQWLARWSAARGPA